MEEEKVCPGCCHKTKERSEKEYKDLLNRLSRIEIMRDTLCGF